MARITSIGFDPDSFIYADSEGVGVASGVLEIEYADGLFEQVEVHGVSRRAPGDKDDRDVAMLLMAARIYENVAAKLHRRARGLIKHHEDVRRDRARRAQRAQQPALRDVSALPAGRRKAVTQQDIADELGLSLSTVNAVLTGNWVFRGVSQSTAAEVERYASAVGYRS